MMGLYTADSGIEKVLYYDRQVRLISSTTACSIGSGCSTNQICSNGYCATVVSRGLCMMADSIHNADRYCQSDSSPASQGEHGIYCNGFTSSGNDCNPTTCSNCTISFDTSLGKKNYHVEAKIYPNGNFSNLEINSKGESGGAQRQIQILNVSQ